MKKITTILALWVLTFTAVAQTSWKADPYHSYLGFNVTHLGIADVPGNFNKYDVTITAAKPDFSDAMVEMTAQIGSINTRVDARDNHLKSADFFDAGKFPTMTFKSTSIKKHKKNKYKVFGNLTMHGITKPVTLEMEYNGTTKNPNAKGAPVAGFKIKAKIKRSDFAIGNGFPAPMISDEVVIKAYGEFGQK